MEWLIPDFQLLCSTWAWTADPTRRELESGWQLAGQARACHPENSQHLLNQATWGAEAVRGDLRKYVSEFPWDPQAVLVVDETGFLKQGTKSTGVARHYSITPGSLGSCICRGSG